MPCICRCGYSELCGTDGAPCCENCGENPSVGTIAPSEHMKNLKRIFKGLHKGTRKVEVWKAPINPPPKNN